MFKTGVTFGVFDCLHKGHINLFKNALKKCDFLIVAVQTDKFVTMNKPGTALIDPLGLRMNKIKRLSNKIEVIPYNQVNETIKLLKFDIFFIGEDQNNKYFKEAAEWCNANNKKIIILRRTPNISSTEIRSIKYGK